MCACACGGVACGTWRVSGARDTCAACGTWLETRTTLSVRRVCTAPRVHSAACALHARAWGACVVTCCCVRASCCRCSACSALAPAVSSAARCCSAATCAARSEAARALLRRRGARTGASIDPALRRGNLGGGRGGGVWVCRRVGEGAGRDVGEWRDVCVRCGGGSRRGGDLGLDVSGDRAPLLELARLPCVLLGQPRRALRATRTSSPSAASSFAGSPTPRAQLSSRRSC